MAESHGEKTEKPTPRRLKEARERGQVARSRDLSMAAGSLAATGALALTGSLLVHRLASAVSDALARLGQAPLRDLRPDDLVTLITSGGALIAVAVGPVALAAAGAGVLSAVAQSGFVVAPAALRFDWQRLSPAAGFRRLAPSKAGLDTLKAIVMATIFATLAWRVASTLAVDAVGLTWLPAPGAAARAGDVALRLLWQIGLALLAIGGADYGIQRWRLWSSLKMSRQELRDEARNTEANPEIRARVRRIQREMSRRRMLHAVPRATVVLTNPTHYAVALEYRREKSAAPIVVAKGRDRVAERIRAIAREHAVPIVENPPLARALFKGAEVGDMIPPSLFSAVAEVLAYLIRIKQLVL
jgi:flagellar biosynthetic protein FlhB